MVRKRKKGKDIKKSIGSSKKTGKKISRKKTESLTGAENNKSSENFKNTGKNSKEEKEKEKDKKTPEKQIKILVIIMAVLILSVLFSYWIFQQMKFFEYNGFKFYKEKEGAILYYKTALTYFATGGESIPFIMKLRNDPRDLEKIPLTGRVVFKDNSVISVSPEILNCSKIYVTLVDFSSTLKAFGITASAATTDEEFAKENEKEFITCEDAIDKTVVMMVEGEETKITKQGNCFVMQINNCEVRESFERFMLGFIESSIVNRF